jgi:hypothetical protein
MRPREPTGITTPPLPGGIESAPAAAHRGAGGSGGRLPPPSRQPFGSTTIVTSGVIPEATFTATL